MSDGSTFVIIAECGYNKTGDELLKAIQDSTGGFESNGCKQIKEDTIKAMNDPMMNDSMKMSDHDMMNRVTSVRCRSSCLIVWLACLDAHGANVHQLATGPIRFANMVESSQ